MILKAELEKNATKQRGLYNKAAMFIRDKGLHRNENAKIAVSYLDAGNPINAVKYYMRCEPDEKARGYSRTADLLVDQAMEAESVNEGKLIRKALSYYTKVNTLEAGYIYIGDAYYVKGVEYRLTAAEYYAKGMAEDKIEKVADELLNEQKKFEAASIYMLQTTYEGLKKAGDLYYELADYEKAFEAYDKGKVKDGIIKSAEKLEMNGQKQESDLVFQQTHEIEDSQSPIPPQDIVNQASISFDSYDVENSLPNTSTSYPEAIAIVIGNNRYEKTSHVDYARSDARSINKYLIEVLGYREGNIFLVENAGKGDFELYFGTDKNPKGKLYNTIKHGVSDVFIFYSGHGAPDVQTEKGFFVPVDADPQYINIQGYSIETFYSNLAKLPAKNKTVVIDACFSGANLFENVSPVDIKIKEKENMLDNTVVLSSSTGNQFSSWYPEKQHGLFTWFFLKALHDVENSDTNGDNKLTWQEVYDYVSDNTEGVPYYARRLHGVEQSPVLMSDDKQKVLIKY